MLFGFCFLHCLQSKLLKFKTIWEPLWRSWIVFLIKGREMAWWVMSPDFCRRESIKPLSVILKVKTQHGRMSLGEGFYGLVFLWASWGEWEEDFRSSKQKSLSNGFIKELCRTNCIPCVATTGFHGRTRSIDSM